MSFETKILDDSKDSIEYAAQLIRSGEIVGMPTETVYGLAADAFNESAVAKIFKAKERPADNPLIVHISDLSMISSVASELPAIAVSCAKAFWPGPLTMVLPKNPDVPLITSGGLDTVGIRMPSHPTALALISASGTPLAAPSGNLSGSPSPTCIGHLISDMNGRIPAAIDGGICEAGVESTVIMFEQNAIKILRPGCISAQMLSTVVPDVRIDSGVLHEVDSSEKAASPGMKYKHYSPKANVTIIDGTKEAFAKFAKQTAKEGDMFITFGKDDLDENEFSIISIGETSEEQAHNLFDALRQADMLGAENVYARCPKFDGVGLAVYNRLIRAAAFKVIKL